MLPFDHDFLSSPPLPKPEPTLPLDEETRLSMESAEVERRKKLRTIREYAETYLKGAKSIYHDKQFSLATDNEKQPYFVQVIIEQDTGDRLSVEMPVVLPLSHTDNRTYALSPDGTAYVLRHDKASNTISLNTICEPLEANLAAPGKKGNQYPLFKGAVDYKTIEPKQITASNDERVRIQDGSGNVRLTMVYTSDRKSDLDTIHNVLTNGLKRVTPLTSE